MTYKRIVIAGTRSGVGKTSIATGLMAALAARGLKVQGFKVGPDYIDPGYHTLATGRPSRNLDTYLMTPAAVLEAFERAAATSDIAVIEGVMGLYDGHRDTGSGSTATIARLLAAPVLLVVDATSLGQSVAAEVLGYRSLDPGVNLAGVILNRVSSEGHLEVLRQAIEEYTGIPVVGWLRRGSLTPLPSRHLGLIPAGEQEDLGPVLAELAATIATGLDLERVLALATQAGPLPAGGSRLFAAAGAGVREKIPVAVALDKAFNFYYQDSLDYLAVLGAELLPFSPLEDDRLPAGAAGIIIGGGFPEIFLAPLTDNRPLLADLRRQVARGIPLYAECGGLMYLAREIIDLEGSKWPMAGIVPAACRMQKSLAGLGYREARLCRETLVGHRDDCLRGHEFHYSTMTSKDTDFPPAYTWEHRGSIWYDGYGTRQIVASYLHLHFLGNVGAAQNFLAACRAYKGGRNLETA
ncbi:cobyrinate a,c-diamide synthase [Neomoorella thermoacetica]|uniref:cobyrinate a,c-diamide synthase n=1 Tax=Neomoorella thermoacetica TaxID=1525 RepID=UPI0008FA972C|nr:cobyrinate a,c-diamide synthase [Moorella thermoacetica]OIQ12754.1 cobyrinic acid A,C-diamide synthase [Moorella thermoacetica]